MKGLVGGIPLAMLVAVAKAQTEVIGGPSGTDESSPISYPITNTYVSNVEDWHHDDHAVDAHGVHHGPPEHGQPGHGPGPDGPHGFEHPHGFEGPHGVDGPHGGPGHPQRRGFPGDSSTVIGGPGGNKKPGHSTGIGGPSGTDEGSDFSAPITNTYASNVEDWAWDDHSINHHRRGFPGAEGPEGKPHGKPPGDATVIGGPSGDDEGNDVDIPITNTYTSNVEDWWKDDHSVNAHHRRGFPGKGGDVTVIGGPSGTDEGQNVDIPITNTYSSNVEDWWKDDHSINHHRRGVPGPHGKPPGDTTVIGGPSGDDEGNNVDIPITNTYWSNVEDWSADDHSINHWKRGGPPHDTTVIGGPSGTDEGNDVDIPITNTYTSNVEDWWLDDHSINHHGRRGLPPHDATVIGGPSGDDEGNNVDIPITNTYSSNVEDWWKDDHSVNAGHPGWKRALRQPAPAEGSSALPGPSGDDEQGPSVTDAYTAVHTSNVQDYHNDDHHVDATTSHDYAPAEPEQHESQQPASSQVQHAPPAAQSSQVHHAPPAAQSSQACQSVHHIVHTVTHTKFATSKPSAAVEHAKQSSAPVSHHSPQHVQSQPAPSQYHKAQETPVGAPSSQYHKVQETSVAAPSSQYHMAQSSQYHMPQQSQASAQPSQYNMPQSSQYHVPQQSHAQPRPSSADALHAPKATSSVSHGPQMQNTPSSSVAHVPMDHSTATLKHASTYVVIPVHVPSSASSLKIYASSTPVSTPSSASALPSSADALRHSPNSEVSHFPSQGSPSGHVQSFTGGSSRLSAGAGVVSVLCGMVAAVAYAL